MRTTSLLLVQVLALAVRAAAGPAPEAGHHPAHPRRYWSLAASILPGANEGRFVLGLDRHPRDLFTFTVRPSDIGLQILDHRRKVAPATASIEAQPAEPLPQNLDQHGGRALRAPIRVNMGQAPAGMYTLRASIRPLSVKDEATAEPFSVTPRRVETRFYWLPRDHAVRTLDYLRQKYEGETAWLYPGLGVEVLSGQNDQASVTPVGLTEAVIRRISLEDSKPEVAVIGSTEEGSGYIRSRAFTVELVFRKPLERIFASFATSRADAGELDVDKALSPPGARYVCRLSGIWDFERRFALKNPLKEHPEWSKRVGNAIVDGGILKGMTPDQVAWAAGWPDEFGTTAEMRKWSTWRYDSAPPFNFWVTFKNGRVARAEPDGTLP